MLLLGPESVLEKVGRLFVGFVLWAVALALLLAILSIRDAHAAPRAQTQDECMVFADMALVARALAIERVDKTTTVKAVARIYDLPDLRLVQIAAAVIELGYRDKREAKDMAAALGRTCLTTGGNMDSILGVSL